MSARETLDEQSLKKLHTISVEMLTLAKLGDWEAVIDNDAKRQDILRNSENYEVKLASNLSRKILIAEILDFDLQIMDLANTQRQFSMDEELRKKAQLTAQTRYKQALKPVTGL